MPGAAVRKPSKKQTSSLLFWGAQFHTVFFAWVSRSGIASVKERERSWVRGSSRAPRREEHRAGTCQVLLLRGWRNHTQRLRWLWRGSWWADSDVQWSGPAPGCYSLKVWFKLPLKRDYNKEATYMCFSGKEWTLVSNKIACGRAVEERNYDHSRGHLWPWYSWNLSQVYRRRPYSIRLTAEQNTFYSPAFANIPS